MTDSPAQVLRDGIARNAAAVISFPSCGMLLHRKTRLLGQIEGGIWTGITQEDRVLVDELITNAAQVGVAFMQGAVKVVFTSPIIARKTDFSVNANLQVEAACLRFPQVIKTVQRRSSYRVSIPSPSDPQHRVWRISEHAILRDRPTPSLELKGVVRDLSIGGMAFVCPPDPQRPPIAAGQRLRITLQHLEIEALMEGRVRYWRDLADRSLRLGIEFNHVQNELEGRQASARLTTIVGQLQRTEVRRLRMGVA